ncbi:chemotaxis protein CheW [Fibrobacterota bacterium]
MSNGPHDIQFVSFYLRDQIYGLDINLIREINPNSNITRVPRAGKEVRGLVNIRGQIVMVIDLNIIFGREALPVEEESQLLILKTTQEVRQIRGFSAGFSLDLLGDNPIALLIDKIGDVIEVKSSVIEPPPPHMQAYKDGIVRIKKEMLIILNLGEILKVK